MKNLFKSFLAFTFLSFLFTGTTIAQQDLGANLPSNTFSYCGATITVYCDGTVDVTLQNSVQIFKVYEGGTELPGTLNTYTDPSIVFNGTTFNTSQIPGNPANVTGNENLWVFLDTDCGQETFNVSQAFAAACPPTIEYCGATWEVDCDGTIDVDFTKAQGINIYKVYNGNQFIPGSEWNNYDPSEPNVQYIQFTAGVTFGNPVPATPGANYFVTKDSDCGQAVINFSQILQRYCSQYNPSSPNYDPTFNHNLILAPEELTALDPKNDRKAESKTIDLMFQQMDAVKAIEIIAYPNPVNDQLNISLPEIKGNYTIQLFNLNGQIMKETQSASGSLEMDMNEFEIGLYLLKIQSDEVSKIEKIQILR